ncbi:hypothetical protein ACWGLK_31685 [Streptomyces albidoflavus]
MTTNPVGVSVDGEGFAKTAQGGSAPAAVEPEPTPVPAVEPPERGAVVRWTEEDPYDEVAPKKVRYGVVIEHTPEGAALVLQLGEIRQAAHFGPDGVIEDGDAPVVSHLTRVR